MAFLKDNLSIVTNNMKAGSTPSFWSYYNEDYDNVADTGFFTDTTLSVGDIVDVYSSPATGGIRYRVSAKSGNACTLIPFALQRITAATVDTQTAATALYNEINNCTPVTLLVTKNANIAATFTASPVSSSYITLAQDVYDGIEVVLTTTTTLPAGLALLTSYYTVDSVGNKCRLSLTRGGASVAITDAGTGTHTATVQKNFFILKDGLEGQRKVIKVKTDGGIDAVILPDNLADGTIITAGDVKDAMELMFIDGEWHLIANNGVAIS